MPKQLQVKPEAPQSGSPSPTPPPYPTSSTSLEQNYYYIYSVLLSFVPVFSIFILYRFLNYLINNDDYYPGSFLYILLILILFGIGNVVSYLAVQDISIMQFSIYWRSSLICNVFLLGYMLTSQQTSVPYLSFGYYLMSLAFFHLSEFVFTALFNSKEVSTDSFLLNHSIEYGLAAVFSWVEFIIEAFLFPSLKSNLYIRFLGLLLIMFGELFRKLAMYTAGTSFNHYVQEHRKDDHVLVTWGVYSFVRHPSYFGWFYWSIGTQVLLANPVCIIVYAMASWKFFKTRITYEEFYLQKFFGKKYLAYQQKVPSGIPFVAGFVQKEESLD